MRVDAHVGGMYTEKSTQALGVYHLFHDIAGIPTVIIKSHRDTRLGDPAVIWTHRNHVVSTPVNVKVAHTPADVLRIGRRYWVVIVEEGHMLPPSLANALRQLVRLGVRCYYFGLDETFEARQFATTAAVLALSETKVFKERGICVRCQGIGKRSQRIWNGRPVNVLNGRLRVLTVGAKKIYRLLCDDCYFRTTPGIKVLLRRGLVGTIDPRTAWGEWPIPSAVPRRRARTRRRKAA